MAEADFELQRIHSLLLRFLASVPICEMVFPASRLLSWVAWKVWHHTGMMSVPFLLSFFKQALKHLSSLWLSRKDQV